MNPTLREGQQLRDDRSGGSIVIGRHLGTGGQGEVYEVRTPDGSQKALKWYLPVAATADQRRRIERLIARGAPGDVFLWPEALVDVQGGRGFGYLMGLRPQGFHSVVDLMAGRVDPSFRALARAGMRLADAFLALHARGLCYGDISFGNVFFHPDTGEVRICDNDNVVVDGSGEVAVLGTPRFMAPEIVRGEAMPDSDTDRHALAVLLFYMLMIHHPLEGRREQAVRCMDMPAMERLYGTDPLFIFDPDNGDNRPVPGEQDTVSLYWQLYPESIRQLFTRAFTDGLHEPRNGRVRESEWRQALAGLIDAVMPCGCGADNFYDVAYIKQTGGKPGSCWSCKAALRLPARLRIGDRVIALAADAKLYAYHLQRLPRDFDERVVAQVEGGRRGEALVLKNLSNTEWTVTGRPTSVRTIAPGQALQLDTDGTVHFGQVRGALRCR